MTTRFTFNPSYWIYQMIYSRWKINAVFNKFCELWENFKNTNHIKAKNKIRKRIWQTQVYFDQQKHLANEFEMKSNIKK